MTRGNYERFYKLIEKEFSVDEITPEKIMDKFYSGTFGMVKSGKDKQGKQRYAQSTATSSGQSKMRGFVDTLAEGGEIYREIDETDDFDELRSLKNRASSLNVHASVVVKKAESRMAIISKELEKISIERKKSRLKQEKEEKDLLRIESKIENANNLITLDRLERQLNRVSDELNTSNAYSLLEGQRASIEASLEEINPDF